MKGKNDSTPFLPLKSKTGGKVMYVQNKEDICLTERQVDHVYKVMEKGNMINTKTMTSKMTQYVSGDFCSCFSNVVSDFLMNKIKFCWRRQAFASFQTWLPQV